MKIKNSDFFSSVPELLSPLFEALEYPFQVISSLGESIENIINDPPDGLSLYRDGVLIGRDVIIEEGATILPPTVIMNGAKIRQGAYIRGRVFVGEGAVVGHCTEVKNSILMGGSEAPHFNYVGDSILGERAHLGAGAVLSNLKADKSSVTVIGDEPITTNMKKLGAILGDGAEVGCNAVLNPGSMIGKSSTVYPLVNWRGTLPHASIAKSSKEIVKKK